MSIKIRTLLAFTLCTCLLVLLGSVPTAHAAEMRMPAPTGTRALQAGAAVIYYVAPGGTGDCTSWATACDLQTALVAAVSGDEIWAAAGVYKPAADPADRTATFQLKAGVPIYGGFAGGETSREARDPAANVTVLSGDLSGDDGANFANNGENSYHVVTGAIDAILDGVTITAGNANGDMALAQDRGGGMYNSFSSPKLDSPKLTNVTFHGNRATHNGGGMYNSSSSLALTSVTFSGNSAGYNGGGMFNSTSGPTLTNVTFSGNSADQGGGGMYNDNNSSPALTNVIFSGNVANTYMGGGMYNDNNSSPTLNDVTFNGNVARMKSGGGMVNHYFSSPTLTNVTFSGNSARLEGGGMYNDNYSSPTLVNVTFSGNGGGKGGGMYNIYYSDPMLSSVTFNGNSAQFGGGMYNAGSSPALTGVTFSGDSAALGGGIYNHYFSSPTLNNVTFSGNTAGSYGGGIYNYFSSSPTLNNVTFSGNVATKSGGGVYNDSSSSPVIRNTILWGDKVGEVANSNSAPTITASVVQGGCPADATCTNVIDTDPRLGALGDYGGATETIPLLPGSSAIDAGLDALPDGTVICPATDQRGVARPQGAHCDIGAFEKELATVALADLSPTYDGQSKTATVTTEPAGLAVVVTYGGSVDLPVNAGDYAVVATIDDTLYQGSASGTLTIQPKAASVTPHAAAKVYGDTDPALSGTLAGFVDGDGVTAAYNRAAGEAVGDYAISAALSPAEVLGNYAITYNSASFSITPRPVTVTADAQTKVEGEADPALTYRITSGSLAFSDAFSGALSRVAGETPGTYPIEQGTLALSDNYAVTFAGAELTITTASNTAPVANPGGPYLGAINTAIVFDGSASSDAGGDPLTYAWDFGDGTTGTGANPSHSYTAAGIYDLCLTVNDGAVDSNPACTLAVVYDPSGGFVTGGGWINSPAGAYVSDPSLAGKATFGFVAKYKKGQSVPSGNTEFQFDVAGFSFHSETYEWLVINKTGTNAQFKGSGTVNGGLDPSGNAYKFMIWAGDGAPDTFRIKIWWEGNGTEVVVYDNGAAQAIGGGSIVIHTR